MNKKVLITGCNGFIGGHLVDFYKKKGFEVFGLDIKINKEDEPNCKFIKCNLQEEDMSKVYKKISPDIFIHCAGNASVGKSVEYPEMDFGSNVNVLYNTLSSITRAEINPKFIFLSTAAVYGNPKVLPISEKTVTAPISPYGLHKMMCEDLCKYYREVNGQNVTVVRIFSAYGEGLRKQILWDMYNKFKNNGFIELFGTGNETRDFINIKDLVQALDLIIKDKKADFVYTVANGEEISIKTLALEFAKILELDPKKITFNGKVKKGDPLNWRADITKLENLQYKKSVNLKEGLRNYIKWVKQNEVG